ncbi:hypothetical protein [Agrobacterium sp. CG674]
MAKNAETNTNLAQKACFVVGPIGGLGTEIRTHADWLLDGIIKPTFRDHFSDFDVVRSDTITSPGMIDTQMINHLLEAELVIVDMSLLNANAFYEMGIRHMARKPVIHMFVAGTTIPFDVKPYRAIEFSVAQHAHLGIAQQQLKSAIQDAISADYVPDNPVTKAQNYTQLERTAEPADKILMKELLALKSEVNALKKSQPNASLVYPQMVTPSVKVRQQGPKLYAGGEHVGLMVVATFPFEVSRSFSDTVMNEITSIFVIETWTTSATQISFPVTGMDANAFDIIRNILRKHGAEIETFDNPRR